MNRINWSNISSAGDLAQAANTATGTSVLNFWVAMLQMIFVVVFLVLINWGWEIAIIIASFLGLILSFLMTYAGLINWKFTIQFAAILLLMFIYILWSGRRQ